MNTKKPRKILCNPPSRDLIDEDLERYRQIALKSKGITDTVFIHQENMIIDIRLVSERAKFSCAFVRIGVTPELCSTYFLPRLIGYGKAAELIFTARPFDAHEALEMGEVNCVFPHNRLMAEARKIAKQIAAMPPTAVQKSKEVLRHGMQSTLDQVIQHEAMVFRDAMKTEEHQLGLKTLITQMKFRDVRTHRSKK